MRGIKRTKHSARLVKESGLFLKIRSSMRFTRIVGEDWATYI